jgi:hypothetical protein
MIISLFMQTPENVRTPHAVRARVRSSRDAEAPGQPAREERKQQQHVRFQFSS